MWLYVINASFRLRIGETQPIWTIQVVSLEHMLQCLHKILSWGNCSSSLPLYGQSLIQTLRVSCLLVLSSHFHDYIMVEKNRGIASLYYYCQDNV